MCPQIHKFHIKKGVKAMAQEKVRDILTKEGLENYKNELAYLKEVKRKEISLKIKEAREQGDLSENAEYDAAKEEQGITEDRITVLEAIIKNAQVVETDGASEYVGFGNTVNVLDIETEETMTFTIKGAKEANVLEGIISNESPLGKALIGKKPGEVIEIEAPTGMISYKIVSFTS